MDIQRKAFESSNNVNPDWSFKFDEELQQYVATDFEMTNQVDEFNEHWDTFRAGWEAKAQAVPEWISAQDKLPEFQQEVLILVGDEYLVAQYLPSATNEFGIQFKEGFWINGGASLVDADLWISLPQPPKAQEPAND